MNKEVYRLLLHNIKQVVTVASKHSFMKLQDCPTIEPLNNISIAVNQEGVIAKIGPAKEI